MLQFWFFLRRFGRWSDVVRLGLTSDLHFRLLGSYRPCFHRLGDLYLGSRMSQQQACKTSKLISTRLVARFGRGAEDRLGSNGAPDNIH